MHCKAPRCSTPTTRRPSLRRPPGARARAPLGLALLLALSSAAGAQEPDEFTSVRLADVVEQLAKEAKREIRVDPRLRDEEVLRWDEEEGEEPEEGPASLREKLEFAVEDLLDGELQELDGVLHVVFMPKIELSGTVRLEDALQAVAEAAERELVLDPSLCSVDLVLGVQFLRWPDVLRALAYVGQLTVETTATTITVTPVTARPAAPAGLVRREHEAPFALNDDGPRLALTLQGESLYDLANRLGALVPGVGFAVLPDVSAAPLTLELPEAPWRRTLNALAAATNTTLVEEEEGVVLFFPASFLHARGADAEALLPALAALTLEHVDAGAEVRGAWDCDYSGYGSAQFLAAAGEANGATVHHVEHEVVLLVGAPKELRQPERSGAPLTWATLAERVQAWSMSRSRGFALIDQAPVLPGQEVTVSGKPAVLREIHPGSLVFECEGERRVIELPTK